MLRLYSLCLVFFVDGLGGWMGETSDCFIDNGARYWMVLWVLIKGLIKAIKNPCGCRGISGIAVVGGGLCP